MYSKCSVSICRIMYLNARPYWIPFLLIVTGDFPQKSKLFWSRAWEGTGKSPSEQTHSLLYEGQPGIEQGNSFKVRV